MKQKTVFTHHDAIILLGILAIIILAGSIDAIADALADFITR